MFISNTSLSIPLAILLGSLSLLLLPRSTFTHASTFIFCLFRLRAVVHLASPVQFRVPPRHIRSHFWTRHQDQTVKPTYLLIFWVSDSSMKDSTAFGPDNLRTHYNHQSEHFFPDLAQFLRYVLFTQISYPWWISYEKFPIFVNFMKYIFNICLVTWQAHFMNSS